MAKSKSRKFADLIKDFYSGTSETKTIRQVVKRLDQTNIQGVIDTVSYIDASAVTFYVNATKNNDHHFAIISVTSDDQDNAIFTEFSTIITDSELAEYSVDINNNTFRLKATPKTTNVTFKVTRIIVE